MSGCNVYNNDLFNDLLRSKKENDQISSSPRKNKLSVSNTSHPEVNTSTPIMKFSKEQMRAKKEKRFHEFWEHQEAKQKEFDKQVKLKVKKLQRDREAKYQKNFNSIYSDKSQKYMRGCLEP